MNGSMFLTDEEVSRLTGRKVKSAQINALKRMGIPFFVNACGRAVVPRVAIEGRKANADVQPIGAWSPRVLSRAV